MDSTEAHGERDYAPASSLKRHILQHADVTVVGSKEDLNRRFPAKRQLGFKRLKRDEKEGKANNALL